MRNNEWREFGLTDDRLHPAINSITRLNATGLTIGHVEADFLRSRIVPLLKRDGFASQYGDAADKMRLLPGLTNNLSVYGHAWLCEQLFASLGPFKLPATVIPLNINSTMDQILKWMPDCNAHGVSGDWRLSVLDDELAWSSTLVERATKVETNM